MAHNTHRHARKQHATPIKLGLSTTHYVLILSPLVVGKVSIGSNCNIEYNFLSKNKERQHQKINMDVFLKSRCNLSLNGHYMQMVRNYEAILVLLERAWEAPQDKRFVCGEWPRFKGDIIIFSSYLWCYLMWVGIYCAPTYNPQCFLVWIPLFIVWPTIFTIPLLIPYCSYEKLLMTF